MKCNNCKFCPALEIEGYEYPEEYCKIRKSGECVEKCYFSQKTINKRLLKIK